MALLDTAPDLERNQTSPGPRMFGAWTLGIQLPEGALQVSDSPAGLRIGATAEAKAVLLSAPLAIPVEARGAGLVLSVTLRSPEPRALQEAVQQLRLVRLGKTGRHNVLLTLGGSLAEPDGADGVRLRASLPWPLAGGRHLVELRLRAGGPPLTLTAAALEATAPPAAARPLPPRPARWPVPERGAGQPLRVAVLTWEVGDNPFGRAYVLADMLARQHGVELLGSQFARPDSDLWPPLQECGLPVRFFRGGGGMAAFLAAAADFAQGVECEVAYLSKARLPGMVLALLLVHRLGCPVVLDLDDHELSFFEAAEAIGLAAIDTAAATAEAADLDRPQGRFWTGVAESLIPSFETRSVAGPSLAERFGGLLVRHGRDETVFHPDARRRAATRAGLGLAEGDRVILFAGTPRRHKGLDRLVAAMAALADPRLVLVVAGSIRDRGMARELTAQPGARVRLLPDTAFAELPNLLQIADGVCLLQDVDSPISHYQTPAKLSDALALGIPVAATPVPAVAELGRQGLVTLIEDEAALQDWLRDIAEGRDRPAARQRRLDWFDAELSYAVNAARAGRVLATALQRPVAWREEWTQLFQALNRRFGSALPEEAPTWAQRPGRAAPALRRRRPIDLVCFWKQNDTGIYGRRHDMLLKYLRRSEQIGTIIQFDAPVRVEQLQREQEAARASPFHHGRLIADATARRFLELDDEPGLLRRTFVHARDGGGSYLGRPLPRAEDYADHVAAVIARHCTGNVVGWSWPIAPLYADIADRLGFDLRVVDLVDDQRVMTSDAARAAVAEESYRRTLQQADLVFANCAAVGEAFAPLSPLPVHVVPNACEFYGAIGGRPAELQDIEGPVIGYVGNLRARIDVALLESLIAARPGWTFVLIGSAHGESEIPRLRRHPNVRLLGPKVYEQALGYMRCFDVAIMPHLRNAVSERMNPLKLYVYVALGIPVVSSDVANIDELRDRIAVAADAEDFLARLDAAVARRGFTGPAQPPSPEALWPISWPKRVTEMLGLCQRALLR
ncbi:glycosyltransferase [Pseudoroseomonas cervicalis]|uniref:glycosyltransferase n=1 Tax=Teichococcus cervicalis TaxID=204525 RepID=UPI0022F1B706|nr:glycosyltransferase [Pseudoroseomonas cervicalis]WBV44042.1 glycosyltransferase [Pseudoroseomonas cervicalis]